MGKYLSTFDTLADYEAATSELGYPNVSLIKADGSILYAKNAPISSICYEIIPETIASYTATTYDSVYSLADAKWYMLNNLKEYEEYGVYDIVENIASATTYEGKLGVVGTTEYQYSGGSWSVVGTYEDVSVTYTIDGTSPSPYVGQELSTTFKIPYADVQAVGYVSLDIYGQDGDYLRISLDTSVIASYMLYQGNNYYQGTVTNDGEYFYLSLPSEAPQSIVINGVDYNSSTPIHLIVGSKQATVEYVEKETPSSALTYSSVADMEAVSCPTVGVGQYCYTNGQAYKYTANDEWVTAQDSDFFAKQFYDDGRVGVLGCGYSDTLNVGVLGNKSGTVPSNDPTIEVYVGDCVSHLGDDALFGLANMTSCRLSNNIDEIPYRCFAYCYDILSIDIPSGVTSIGESAFQYCASLTSITIPSSVTSIGGGAFQNCENLTSITIPSSVTSIGGYSFAHCSGLTSINIPSSVTSIGGYSFAHCSGLTSINIPSSVTSIGDYSFQYCASLTSIDIPSGVTSIGVQAFFGCSSLTSVTVNATTPPTLGSASFNGTSNCPIYVPSASVSAYKSNWSNYASRIRAIS